MKLSIIVAMAENGVIGQDGGLPWRLSADLQRFKRLTMDHCIIMGRKTFESIGRALPGRISIVVSRDPSHVAILDNVLTATDLEAALELVSSTPLNREEAFVIGGAEIYRLALPQAKRIYLTRVLGKVEGDTYFPEVDWQQWKLGSSERHYSDAKNDFDYCFEIYDRG